RSWSLEYDVWEDRYSIVTGDSVTIHEEFDSMAGMIENLRGISLFPKGTFEEGSRYSVRFCVSVNPLSGRSGRQLEGWVEDNVRRGGEGWKEQVMSISDMISYFFKRDGDRTARSEWYATGSFRLSDLPGGDE
ncbi:MAG TPA: hypothetical protein VLA34_10940, partial [Candidatus Krumholzibacterium sp.]|nr:hypothetical protein [Candidatus Krumholzibacterium sp.]